MSHLICFAVVFLDVLKESKENQIFNKNKFSENMILSGKKQLIFQVHLN